MADIEVLMPLIKQFMPFAQERMGFKEPPRLFLKGDSNNAAKTLGRTAFYDPAESAVTLYITDRHPKDIMRSLSHELVHHMQNCNGDFENVGEMGEGYAQNNPHMREMERQAYEMGNMCFRDWEDSIKQTIYFEHLQKGDITMSTKDWKNQEIKSLLAEAWGFGFNLENLTEERTGSGIDHGGDDDKEAKEETEGKADSKREEEGLEEEAKPDYIDLDGDGDKDETMTQAAKDAKAKKVEESEEVFAPNHYCVHHGGVNRSGKIEMAEAVNHNWNEELGRVTHYDMKFEDGTIMENVPFEDIQVTNASLAEGHGDHPAKRDDRETDPCEGLEGMALMYCQGHVNEESLKEEKLRALVRQVIKDSMK